MRLVLKWCSPWEAAGATVFEQSSLLVGRAEDCDIRLRDRTVSRRHCEFRQEDDGWIVEDLESRNGTRVNGHPVRQAWIAVGDTIMLGMTSFQILEEPAGVVALARPGRAEH